ncbi:MAG: STAS domain-containing protein [Clostridiales Family XIII bacterium]|jgi:anti-anti-sigma factor|nr:STAS domain-containing protein [Clostridiales Family XIII bacterium]
MQITTSIDEKLTTLSISGRIDTNTSSTLEAEITKALQSSRDLVLDFADVDHVSSAGFRVLLIGQKMSVSKQSSMKIINVSDYVRALFDMVGLLKVLIIE